MDKLIKAYKDSMHQEELACKEVDESIYALQTHLDRLKEKRSTISAPFEEERKAIIAEIEPLIISHGKTYKCASGEVGFRKGARRVTYDWVIVDAVRGALGAILPDLAGQLDKARSETVGKPTFSIK